MKPKTLISGLCILLAVCLAIYFYAEWQKQEFDATLPVPPEPPAEEQTGGHWHGDEWHADDAHGQDGWQPGDELIPSVDWQPNVQPHEAVKPEGLVDAAPEDPVAKAWAKVDYIAANPFAWGGNADPRTAGLVQQLMPRPEGIEDEGHAEGLLLPLDDLIRLRDPRAIETLVAYLCWDYMAYGPLGDAVADMGPLAIPYLLPYLEEEPPKEGEYFSGFTTAAGFLSIIGKENRGELDGVIEYIILPKLKEILAKELPHYVRREIEDDIARLKQ